MGDRPVLVVIGGLPATGKSTVAETFARRLRIPYVRVDRIEQTIVDQTTLSHPLGPVGYALAHELTTEQLLLGLDVVVECVNPLEVTRQGWRTTAARVGARLVEVELVCSDEVEHRRRVEARTSDVEGLVKPSWSAVEARDHEPWTSPHLVLDSAVRSVEDMVAAIGFEVARQSDPCLP